MNARPGARAIPASSAEITPEWLNSVVTFDDEQVTIDVYKRQESDRAHRKRRRVSSCLLSCAREFGQRNVFHSTRIQSQLKGIVRCQSFDEVFGRQGQSTRGARLNPRRLIYFITHRGDLKASFGCNGPDVESRTPVKSESQNQVPRFHVCLLYTSRCV